MLEELRGIIIKQLDLDEDYEINEGTSLDSFDLDSIDAVELIMSIEDNYEIEVPDDNAENFKNIGDILKYLESL